MFGGLIMAMVSFNKETSQDFLKLFREARKNGYKSILFGGEDFDIGYARYCLAHLSRQGLIDRKEILDILEEISWN